jgi:3-hydroxy-9,10-secoandrosta-1,3,5(10)-triene-9,17-dione monooxygenase
MNLAKTATEQRLRLAAQYRPDLVDAARSIAANLPLRRAETDTLRHIPASTMAELEAAHLFDIMKPRAYGGQEASLETMMDCIVALAEGDGAVGWTAALLNDCAWAVSAFYSEDVASEIFAAGSATRVAGAFQPSGARVRRTEGGVVVDSGTWAFVSGIHHADWVALGLPLFDDAGQLTEQLFAIIPVSEVQILDDWQTSGLRGTGSNSVSLSDVFIPDERALDFSKLVAGDYGSAHLEGKALYRHSMIPVFSTNLAFSGLGIAKAVLDGFIEKATHRGIAHTQYRKQSEAAVTHLQVGEASAKIDCADLLLRANIRNIGEISVSGSDMPLVMRTEIRRNASYANKLLGEAVDMLVGASGGTIAYTDHPLNRLWRDARAAGMHPGLNAASGLELHGRVLFGLDPMTPMV